MIYYKLPMVDFTANEVGISDSLLARAAMIRSWRIFQGIFFSIVSATSRRAINEKAEEKKQKEN